MSEEFEDLEKRLGNLKPLEPEALAGRILDDWQMVRGEVVADARFARPRRRFASFSLCSACIGAIAGAAATFLGMIFLLPPKVEIREVVREVHAKAEPEAGNNVRPEIEWRRTDKSASGPPESGPENRHSPAKSAEESRRRAHAVGLFLPRSRRLCRGTRSPRPANGPPRFACRLDFKPVRSAAGLAGRIPRTAPRAEAVKCA